jgi:hypothetical protein
MGVDLPAGLQRPAMKHRCLLHGDELSDNSGAADHCSATLQRLRQSPFFTAASVALQSAQPSLASIATSRRLCCEQREPPTAVRKIQIA